MSFRNNAMFDGEENKKEFNEEHTSTIEIKTDFKIEVTCLKGEYLVEKIIFPFNADGIENSSTISEYINNSFIVKKEVINTRDYNGSIKYI